MDGKDVVGAVHALQESIHDECIGRFGRILEPKQLKPCMKKVSDEEYLAHLHFMCAEIPKFVIENRLGKAMRWLGFVQGVLCSRFERSITSMKMLNQPDLERVLK